MAEYVLIYDTATGNLLSKQAGASHIASAAVQSGHLASGQVGGFHLAALGVLSAHLAAEVIGDPHVRSGVLDAARLTGTLQDARLPTTQAGKTFSGQVIANARDGFYGSGLGTVDIGPGTAGRPFANLNANNQGSVGQFFVSGTAWRLSVDAAGDGVAFQRSPPGAPGAPISLAGIMRVISGDVDQIGRWDGVDVSAHTHTGGAGDAGLVLSAGIGSGQLGPHLAALGVLSAHLAVQAVGLPHLVRGATSGQALTAQGAGADPAYAAVAAGILSSDHSTLAHLSGQIGSGQIGAEHIFDNAVVSGKVASGLQDLSIIAFRRPPELLDRTLFNDQPGNYSLTLPTGFSMAEVYGNLLILSGQQKSLGMGLNGMTSAAISGFVGQLRATYASVAAATLNRVMVYQMATAPLGRGNGLFRAMVPLAPAEEVQIFSQWADGAGPAVCGAKYQLNADAPVSGIDLYLSLISGGLASGSVVEVWGRR